MLKCLKLPWDKRPEKPQEPQKPTKCNHTPCQCKELPASATRGALAAILDRHIIHQPWEKIAIHHSLTEDSRTGNAWEAIRRYHKEQLGFKDIGYHFGIEYLGAHVAVRAGRALYETGAHAKGFNNTAIGICIVGNYDTKEPEEDKLTYAAALCGILMDMHSMDPDDVLGHREINALIGNGAPKTCPGSKFDMKKLMAFL